MADTVGSDPIQVRLNQFLEHNQEAEYARENGQVVILRPWGDTTIKLGIKDENDPLIEVLNSVYLPPRLQAIWHRDSKDLEIILPNLDIMSDLSSRSFKLQFQGRSMDCEYVESSERLLLIAGALLSETGLNLDFRGLLFHAFFQGLSKIVPNLVASGVMPPPSNLPKMISFWIRNIEWDTDYVSGFTTS